MSSSEPHILPCPQGQHYDTYLQKHVANSSSNGLISDKNAIRLGSVCSYNSDCVKNRLPDQGLSLDDLNQPSPKPPVIGQCEPGYHFYSHKNFLVN